MELQVDITWGDSTCSNSLYDLTQKISQKYGDCTVSMVNCDPKSISYKNRTCVPIIAARVFDPSLNQLIAWLPHQVNRIKFPVD